MAKIIVKDAEVNVVKVDGEDYICLTDMMCAKDGGFFITDWLRNRNTLEYIGIWEKVYNPEFNYGEFAIIRSQSGLNSFKISVKEFVARTNAISLQAKAGRYGGTLCHTAQRAAQAYTARCTSPHSMLRKPVRHAAWTHCAGRDE